VREFVKSSGHADRYSNLKVNYVDHHNPDLILFDAEGQELHRIDLTRLSSTGSMHRLMLLLGLREICQDANSSCESWSSAGECERNAAFMHSTCRKSCRLCSDGATVVDEVLCRDLGERRDCEYWSTMGECQSNPTFMREQCARSCRFCEVSVAEESDDDDEFKDEL